MTINGAAVGSDQQLSVLDPATGRPFAECPDCSEAQLDQAVRAAKAALPTWQGDGDARRAALLKCADAIEAQAQAIAPVLTQEQGKPLAKALEELYGAALWFRSTAALPLEDQLLREDENFRVELRRRPLGVVAGITPWNFPVLLAVWKIAPALLAGNTFILKPSPYTPLSSLALGELSGALPPGVFNVVSGGDQLGRWLSAHPECGRSPSPAPWRPVSTSRPPRRRI